MIDFSDIPPQLERLPIFSYIDWSDTYPTSIDWRILSEIPSGSCPNLAIRQLSDCFDVNAPMDPEVSRWLREKLTAQEFHFSDEDWRFTLKEFYGKIFEKSEGM
jgi:hypothetical protein